MSQASDFIRNIFKEGDDKRDAGLVIPDEVKKYPDITYGNEGKHPAWQMLDVYRPKSEPEEKKLPTIIVVHGGGWVYGDKERYQFYAADLSKRGFAVVCFSYRLAPEHTFPSSLIDSLAVLDWVEANADKYGFDLNNVFGAGDSAGGTLLAQISVFLTNNEYASMFEFKRKSKFIFKGCALNCAAFTLSAVSDADENMGNLMNDLIGKKVTDEDLEILNVKKYITPDFPTSFVMSASEDFLRYEIYSIVESFVKNNVEFKVGFYKAYESKEPLGHVFHCNLRLPESTKCNDEECNFFRELAMR